MSTQDRAPSFPFYPKDWLADARVRGLSLADRGRYIDLLASMWDYSDAGCEIPRKLAESILGKPFVRTIADAPDAILLTYTREEDGMAFVFSNRLFQEAQKCRSRSLAAKQSADARWEAERMRRADAD